ncbi:tetraacyldisaccharide 4'-kinase [Candidatus Providencia siddallii]|uniref:Tetraacyldisaccharide 4'-kinase n=1 Tax=Candidatus Providencia siddallii TaxID=1715285 RepID=A0ABP1CE56_9GAMM
MIEQIWFNKSWLYILLIPLSFLYELIIFLKKISYKIKLLRSWKSPIPVIIVGNITIGGNGKTPVVIWLVESLKKEGYKVGVISRGYKGKTKKYPLIVDSNTTTQTAGDEPILIFQRTKVPIAVAPKRKKAIQTLLNKFILDVIITDDGLQHYALQRDYEIIVIDGQRRFGNGFLLPAGPMRERKNRLTKVNALIINGGNSIEKEIEMSLEGNFCINLLTKKICKITDFNSVVAIAGIGFPYRFFMYLKNKGLILINTYAFSDHKYYKLQELISLTKQNEILFMTEKDAVKCQNFAQNNWWYVPIYAKLNKQKSKIILKEIKKIILKKNLKNINYWYNISI